LSLLLIRDLHNMLGDNPLVMFSVVLLLLVFEMIDVQQQIQQSMKVRK
jgi:hypothetical protein